MVFLSEDAGSVLSGFAVLLLLSRPVRLCDSWSSFPRMLVAFYQALLLSFCLGLFVSVLLLVSRPFRLSFPFAFTMTLLL